MRDVKALIPRHLSEAVRAALKDTRVVVVLGARQAGKSTLIQALAREDGRRLLTLDDAATRQAALEDPTGFVARLPEHSAIDEVQRAPDLMLAIKQSVDADPRPGRFLLTGSANLLTAPTIADALTGRTEYLHLWPFSQAELRERRPDVLAWLFGDEPPNSTENVPIGRTAYAEILTAGGFPEAVGRTPARRLRFFDAYLDTVLDRDLATIAQVHDRANVRRLLGAIAAVTGSTLNLDGLSRDLGVAANTVRSHVDLLTTLFLCHRLPAWHSNLLSRVIRAPKLHIADSGLLAHLLGADARRIAEDGEVAGRITQTFAVTEILRHADVADDRPQAFHFRDRDGREVDLVLERRDGSVAAVEVKAAATVTHNDFRGLRHLRDRLGRRLAAGTVLYTGAETLPFGERLNGVPLAALWT
jgi:hypothetical protein